MKLKYLPLLFISFLIASSSCMIHQPVSTQVPKNNDSYTVDYLFEHDGCKVYRFFDRGNYVYFTNCCSEISAYPNDSTTIRTISGRKDNPLLPTGLK